MANTIVSETDSKFPFWWQLKEFPIFCGFTDMKRPVGIDGVMGIAEAATTGRLGTYDQAKAIKHPYVGLSLLHPFEIKPDQYLVCIDLDWKNATDYQPHTQQLQLMTYLNKCGAAYETSLSGHGAHYWVTIPKDKIPKCITLPENRQIEFFSGFSGQKKNILLTDWDFTGELKEVNVMDYLPSNSKVDDAKLLLNCIDAEDYQEWISVGMILKKELSDLGYELWDQWSRKSNKYDPFIMSQKWDSFKKEDGIGIKQLIRLSKKYGFQGQINSFNNPDEDFNIHSTDILFPDIIDPDTGEVLVKDIWEGRIIEPMTVLTSPNWVIDGFMADGLTLIAGAPGVGKTSAIVPLAMQVAGFYSHFSNISIKIRRKVIYLSEDTGQVQRIQYALQKRLKRIEADLPIEWPEISEWFKVVATKRSSASDIAKLAILAAKNISQFPDITGQLVDIKPLIVIDTASASFNVDSENDNAEIAKYISAIKEGLIARGYPVWVVTHTPKALKRADVRDFSARGAGAWEGDANCVAYLFQEEGLEERFLKLGKHRYQSDFDEVAFESNLYAEFVTDQLRGAIEISVRWAIPSKSMESKRIEAKEMAKEEKFENLKNSRKTEILDVIQSEINAGRYPNKRSIRNLIKGRTEEIMAIIDDLIEAGSIMEIDLPDDLKVGNKKTSLVPNYREPLENPFK